MSICNSKPLQNDSTVNYFPLLKTRDCSLARAENSQITVLIPLPTPVESHPASQRATLCCRGAATARPGAFPFLGYLLPRSTSLSFLSHVLPLPSLRKDCEV